MSRSADPAEMTPGQPPPPPRFPDGVGILRAKQLKELKLKKELKAVTKFVGKNIGKCYKTAAR